jgi:hypothetical protein
MRIKKGIVMVARRSNAKKEYVKIIEEAKKHQEY